MTSLIVFSGLPGTGKTTIARPLAARMGAMYLRIDAIEQAMKTAGASDIGPAGYAVAQAIAEANLRLGNAIVADCVNPVRASRDGWRSVANHASVEIYDILLICSDVEEHRRRVETRTADIPGLVVPKWDNVTQHGFEQRDDAHFVLDTAATAPEILVERCHASITKAPRP